MAKPAHTRITFEGYIGALAAPLEFWSFNVNFPADAQPGDAPGVVADGYANDCATAYYDNILPEMPLDVHHTKVTVAHINADGLVDQTPEGVYSQGTWTGDRYSAFAAQSIPIQTALCVSLTTSREGPTGKGRFFLPWPRYVIEAGTKRLSAADALTMANAAKGFLDDLAVFSTFQPQVVSSKGYMSEVTGVRVGRVPDTMRSRRRDLIEGYQAVPLA